MPWRLITSSMMVAFARMRNRVAVGMPEVGTSAGVPGPGTGSTAGGGGGSEESAAVVAVDVVDVVDVLLSVDVDGGGADCVVVTVVVGSVVDVVVVDVDEVCEPVGPGPGLGGSAAVVVVVVVVGSGLGAAGGAVWTVGSVAVVVVVVWVVADGSDAVWPSPTVCSMSVVVSGSGADTCARAVGIVSAIATIAPTSTSVHRLLMTVCPRCLLGVKPARPRQSSVVVCQCFLPERRTGLRRSSADRRLTAPVWSSDNSSRRLPASTTTCSCSCGCGSYSRRNSP